MSQEEAFIELYRNAGTQFDPVLVQRFITVIANRSAEVETNPLRPARKRRINLTNAWGDWMRWSISLMVRVWEFWQFKCKTRPIKMAFLKFPM